MILCIDNYDSFVFNLARYLERLGQRTVVVRNDALDAAGVADLRPDAIVLSPGPKAPDHAGCSLEVVRTLSGKLPILGICLGHQTIGAAFGARVVRAPSPVHGRPSAVHHTGQGLWSGLPNPFQAGRYHSLVVEEATLPPELLVTARSSDGLVMALEHRDWPIVGWQFHPESILTECGYELLAAFLKRAGLFPRSPLPDRAQELAEVSPGEPPEPRVPVTF